MTKLQFAKPDAVDCELYQTFPYGTELGVAVAEWMAKAPPCEVEDFMDEIKRNPHTPLHIAGERIGHHG